jgi:hypothetical protein
MLAGVIALSVGFSYCARGTCSRRRQKVPVKADLNLRALGGDNGGRAARVLEMYRNGLNAQSAAGWEGVHSKTRAAYLSWRCALSDRRGRPEKALLYDRRSANSWEEARNTLRLMQEMKLDRVLVVSDRPICAGSPGCGAGCSRAAAEIRADRLRHGGLGCRALVAYFAERAIRLLGIYQARVLPRAVLGISRGLISYAPNESEISPVLVEKFRACNALVAVIGLGYVGCRNQDGGGGIPHSGRRHRRGKS